MEVPVRGYYPTWRQSVYNTTLKSKKLGLLVDTGAYDNIGGSESSWFQEFMAKLNSLGITPSIRDIPKITVSGVGAGAAIATQAFTFPGAVLDDNGVAQNIMFDAPTVNGSPIPPLWGLQSLRKYRALIDCQGLKLHLLGAGDLRLTLPPGSQTYPLELSEGGHLILPIGEFETLKSQTKTNITPKKTLSFASHPELIQPVAPVKTTSQGTQTSAEDFTEVSSSQPRRTSK